jgi:uncharacterized protein YgbK (DUF1537 family)
LLDVRILADDLTGALDSAVAFAGSQGIDVTWNCDWPIGRRTAVDVATREGTEATAIQRHQTLASWLAGGTLRFKKVDSLLRGHVVAEIDACIRGGAYERVIVAPAFPFHGRATRSGRQWRLGVEAAVVGPNLAEGLTRGFPCSSAQPGETSDSLITIYDAECDTDLDRIVATEMAISVSCLLVGSGGLAAALARYHQISTPPKPRLTRPFLGLVGTDHAVTAAQIEHFAGRYAEGHIVIDEDLPGARKQLAARIRRSAPSLISVVAAGSREAAARHINGALAALLEDLPVPGTLMVTGGETLRSVCNALRANLLTVTCEFEPGLPVSRLRGGPFHGLTAISKSGAFGAADLLLKICDALEG